MNFEKCIQVHKEWEKMLKDYLDNPDGSLDPDILCQDNLCVIGRWIDKEGKYILYPSEARGLKDEHKNFHQIIAQIVKQAHLGENVLQDHKHALYKDFHESSSNIVALLTKLNSSFNKALIYVRK